MTSVAPMASHNLLLSFLSLLLLLLHGISLSDAVKAGYWTPGSGLPASSIDSTLFTHLLCAFADLNSSTNQVTISSSNAAAFSTFTSTVRQKNPSVITLLSIGGGSSNNKSFAAMASQPSSRKTFIDSSVQVARSNGFLGLDLDWQYPNSDADMTNMGTLFNEWRAAIKADASSAGRDPLLLTAAVYFSANINSLTYPVDSISNNLDWVDAMAYNFYSPAWKLSTRAHAALYDPSGEVSGSAGIDDWLNAGLASDKLVLGMPYYGYAWNLSDPAQHGLGAPATGKAISTEIDTDGAIVYNQIKAFIQNTRGATTVYNETVVVNYCYAGTTWIGYDDVQAVAAKVAYAKKKGLRGYAVWQLSGDDNWLLSQQDGDNQSFVPCALGSCNHDPSAGNKKNNKGLVLGIAIPVAIALVSTCILFICFCRGRSRKRLSDEAHSEEIVSIESLILDLSMLKAATANFSELNKLGEGGFGSVYKGLLSDGQEIAVKRLSRNSSQGLGELKNELVLVAKLHHRNLVRLLGVCLEEQEKLLVYEYVPNRSLDTILFDPTKRQQLYWGRRYKIIEGVARALVYLHEDSRLTIVHRDLKASNILLDANMRPKISDFGLARLFGEDQTRSTTSRVVGTFGYMAPEYARHGQFSIKSDVYSFGVLVLEIVTGRKNNDFVDSEHDINLISHTWDHWTNGTLSEIIDPSLGGHCPRNEVERCIQIGLLSLQENPADRPSMSSIIVMLNSYSVTLQAPTRPGFYFGSSNNYTNMISNAIETSGSPHGQSKSTNIVPLSRNEISISELEGR